MLHLVSHLSFVGIVLYVLFAPMIILAIWILLQILFSLVDNTVILVVSSIVLFVILIISVALYDISYVYWLVLNFSKLSAFKKAISILLFIWLYISNRTTTNTAKNRT